MNCLLIDAGNTRIKWAVQPDQVSACPTLSSAEHMAQHVVQHIAGDVSVSQQSAWVVYGVCVAQAAVRANIDRALHTAGLPAAQWLSGATPLPGLRNDYATPDTLGADRWLAAYGLAERLTAQSAVLATFGTATTVDVLRWDAAAHTHAFAGGIIVAGLNTALRSVSASTAHLPDLTVQLQQFSVTSSRGLARGPGAVRQIPNNTQDALLQGALAVQAGAVQQMLSLLNAGTKHADDADTACFIAGGAAAVMQPYLPQAALIEHPVLLGLHRYAQVGLSAAGLA